MSKLFKKNKLRESISVLGSEYPNTEIFRQCFFLNVAHVNILQKEILRDRSFIRDLTIYDGNLQRRRPSKQNNSSSKQLRE